jgi:hypothetical protein
MSIWEGIQIVLTIFEIGMCIWICDAVVYDGEVVKENKGIAATGIVGVVLLFIVIGSRRYVFFSWVVLLAQIYCTWFILTFGKRENKVLCFACILDYYLLESLMDLTLASFGVSYLGAGFWQGLYYKVSGKRVLIYFLTRLLLFGMGFALKRYKKKNYFCIRDYRSALFSFGALGCIWGWLLLTALAGHANHAEQINSLFIVSCLLILLSLMAIELKNTRVRSQFKMAQMKNEMLEQNYKNLQNLYMSNQYVFHDFKHHIVLLKNYLENCEYEKAVQYLGMIVEPVDRLSKFVYTGCDVLDLVLNIKGDEADQKGIRYQVETEGDLKININENDLGNIFFNLLDNAIEACEKIKKHDRWIRVVIKRKNQIHIVKIENSIEVPVFMVDGEYRTDKDRTELHGLGIKSVESCVKHYGGNARWSHTGDVFTVVITFFENGL